MSSFITSATENITFIWPQCAIEFMLANPGTYRKHVLVIIPDDLDDCEIAVFDISSRVTNYLDLEFKKLSQNRRHSIKCTVQRCGANYDCIVEICVV